MQFVKWIFRFYINASIHVALAVYCMVRVTEVYFDLSYNQNLNYFIFYATITGYNFVKYAGLAKFYHQSLTKNLQLIQIFSFLCFLVMCYYAYLLPVKMLLYFLPFSVLTILYAVPFLEKFHKNLRQVSFLKIFVVAFVWSGVTTVIPLLANGFELVSEVVFLFIQRMLFVIVLILPFEIRDMKLDIPSIRTLPQIIGIEQTKRFGFALLLFVLTLEFVITDSYWFRNISLLICFILLFFVMRAKEKQPKYYSSFWVESLPILWFLLILLVT